MKSSMQKLLIIFSLLFAVTPSLYAQRDTIFFVIQPKVACFVKEVDPDVIVYTYPGETVINTVYRNTVQKIKFRNGRVQIFSKAKNYLNVNGINDYDNVAITSDESDLLGLDKIGTVSSKLSGGNDKIYKRLKIQAAMLGANVIYIHDQSASNEDDNYFLTATAYSSTLLDMYKFKQLIGNRTGYVARQTNIFAATYNEISADVSYRHFIIKNITSENGIINITGSLKDEDNVTTFQLVNFNKDEFDIAYQKAGTTYNVMVTMENVNFVK